MGRRERWFIVLLFILFLGAVLCWRSCQKPGTEQAPLPLPVPVPVSTVTVPAPPAPPVPKVTPKPPKPKAAATTASGAPVPPKLDLHKELIPKNIEIARCYYAAEVAPPGTTFGFDINGSGFNSEFKKMITVEAGHAHVLVKNLTLVTANQIHGEIEVGASAPTGFVYPRVLIKGLPVFSAPEPFAVVRKGEVLTVFFTTMEEDGRGGNFRVITNLDEAMAKTFRVEPSTPGIQISDLQPQLPYLVQGRLKIGPGVPPGEHGLSAYVQDKLAFRRLGMIRIVRPTLGQMGFVQNLIAEERYRRPGDPVQIYLQGTGLSAKDVPTLKAAVVEVDMGPADITYISPLQLRLTFRSPGTTPVGVYSVKITGENNAVLFEKKNLFQMVPANWVAGVQVSPPLKAGGTSQLRVIGRDFTDAYKNGFKIESDEPGIRVGPLSLPDPSQMVAEIYAAPGTSAGDYWLHLSANGQKITPPFGSIIKVEAAH